MPSIAKSHPSTSRKQPPSSYLALAALWEPRPIRTAKEAAEAMAVIEPLAVKGEDALDVGEAHYLDAVSTFLEAYDDEHHPRKAARGSGAERLRGLVEEAGMSVSELGKIVGSQSYASLLMSGKRKASRNVALALGKYFKMNPGYFL